MRVRSKSILRHYKINPTVIVILRCYALYNGNRNIIVPVFILGLATMASIIVRAVCQNQRNVVYFLTVVILIYLLVGYYKIDGD